MYVVFLFYLLPPFCGVCGYFHVKEEMAYFLPPFTFPLLFMMTYIPITVAALFKKVEGFTKHDIAVNFEDVIASSGVQIKQIISSTVVVQCQNTC